MIVVALKEQSDGNETVGTSWIESNVFRESDTLLDVLKWAELSYVGKDRLKRATRYGRLMLSIPTNAYELDES